MDNASDEPIQNFQQKRHILEQHLQLHAQSRNQFAKLDTMPYLEPIKIGIHPSPPIPIKTPLKKPPTQISENKSETELNFKITGKTLAKIVDILTNKQIKTAEESPNAPPIYDYLPSDVLTVSLKVTTSRGSSPTTSSSSTSDAYIKPRQYDVNTQYVNMNETSDLTKVTIIKDYNFNGLKDLNTVRVGSRIYYDKYQNPRIERHFYTSVLDEPRSSKHMNIISEIIRSEYNYVTELHYVYHNYILHFREKAQKHLSKMFPFFMLIEHIYLQQSEFYKKLASSKSVEDVATHFLENEKLFGLYRNYILNLNTVHRYLTIEYRFEVLKRQQEVDSQTSLEDCLISPIQRLNKYIILFEELESLVQPKIELSSKINVIVGIFKKLLVSSKADSKIVDYIINRPPTLVNFGGFIMKESFYIKRINPGVKQTVFLFQEVIIFTTRDEDGFFTYKHHILMRDLYIRVTSDNPISFEIMNFHTPKNKENLYVLETVDPRTKDVWVEVIESLLWEQLMMCKSKVGDKVFKEKLV